MAADDRFFTGLPPGAPEQQLTELAVLGTQPTRRPGVQVRDGGHRRTEHTTARSAGGEGRSTDRWHGCLAGTHLFRVAAHATALRCGTTCTLSGGSEMLVSDLARPIAVRLAGCRITAAHFARGCGSAGCLAHAPIAATHSLRSASSAAIKKKLRSGTCTVRGERSNASDGSDVSMWSTRCLLRPPARARTPGRAPVKEKGRLVRSSADLTVPHWRRSTSCDEREHRQRRPSARFSTHVQGQGQAGAPRSAKCCMPAS